MANLFLLMQFQNETETSTSDLVRMMMISEVGCGISLIGCVLTLCLLCFLPIRSDGLFITGNMCLLMMVAQISFIGAENVSYPDPIMCKVATSLLHYFFLCFHFSSVAYGIYLWTKIGPGAILARRKKGWYVTLIWATPLLIVLVTLFARGDLYGTEQWCWLPTQHYTRLAFLVPILIILLVNLVLYIVVVIARYQLDYKKGEGFPTMLKHFIESTVSMFPLLNLHWFLGFSVTLETSLVLQYTYVALSSGQGVLILIFGVLTNGQVQKHLCSKIAEREGSISSTESADQVQQSTGHTQALD